MENVELCEEVKKTVEDNNMCAKLRMSVKGTKAAVQNWQKKVQETMATLGFSIGKEGFTRSVLSSPEKV